MTDDVSIWQAAAEPTAVRSGPREVQSRVPKVPTETVFTIEDLSFFYGDHKAISDVSMTIGHHEVTAFIGPSGCGKTTFLRCLNRLNDLIPDTRTEGQIDFLGHSIFGADVKPIELRRRIGMTALFARCIAMRRWSRRLPSACSTAPMLFHCRLRRRLSSSRMSHAFPPVRRRAALPPWPEDREAFPLF